jgi:hypothetical protein
MHKILIYKTPGGYGMQDLTDKKKTVIYRTLRQLVQDCFKYYHSYLVKEYGEEMADNKLKYIISYLKNWFQSFNMQVLEFPGDLNTGEIKIRDRKSMPGLTETLFT